MKKNENLDAKITKWRKKMTQYTAWKILTLCVIVITFLMDNPNFHI